MKCINIFGGPGLGKSTFAAALFAKMKNLGHRVELVTEFAKDATYENRKTVLSNQLYVTAKQFHRMERLRGSVDTIITDSPILLGLIYKPDWYYVGFEDLVWALHGSFDNYNYFILRDDRPYQSFGRNQSEEEAKEIDSRIKNILAQRFQKYKSLDFGENRDRFDGEVERVCREIASLV